MEGGGVWEAAPEGGEGGAPVLVQKRDVSPQTLTPTPTLTLLERAAECRHPTGREKMGSPTLRTHQDPILLLPWLCFEGADQPWP